MTGKNLGGIFLLAILLGSLYLAFLVLQPFLSVILIAAILAILFYPAYLWLVKKVSNKSLASILVCLLVLAIILIPISDFVVILTQKSIEAYNHVQTQLQNGALDQNAVVKYWDSFKERVQTYLPFLNFGDGDVKTFILSLSDGIRNFLVSSTTGLIRNTTQLAVDFLLVILALYYFFKDGPAWLSRIMQLTPLENKYDQEIFKKFREVSIPALAVTLLIAAVQGLLGGLGFFLVGVPGFFLGIVIAFLALVPVIGSTLVYVPASLILIFSGRIGAGVFMLIYSLVLVSLIDSFLRAWLLKGRAKIHPLFVFFSVLGGLSFFGFWGIIYGPLILSLTITLLHIYELEYAHLLEK